MVPSSGWITASVEQATKAEKCENLAHACRNRYETRGLHGLSPETCPGEQKLPQRTFVRSRDSAEKSKRHTESERTSYAVCSTCHTAPPPVLPAFTPLSVLDHGPEQLWVFPMRIRAFALCHPPHIHCRRGRASCLRQCPSSRSAGKFW